MFVNIISIVTLVTALPPPVAMLPATEFPPITPIPSTEFKSHYQQMQMAPFATTPLKNVLMSGQSVPIPAFTPSVRKIATIQDALTTHREAISFPGNRNAQQALADHFADGPAFEMARFWHQRAALDNHAPSIAWLQAHKEKIASNPQVHVGPFVSQKNIAVVRDGHKADKNFIAFPSAHRTKAPAAREVSLAEKVKRIMISDNSPSPPKRAKGHSKTSPSSGTSILSRSIKWLEKKTKLATHNRVKE